MMNFEIDHIIPLNLGGSNNIKNLQALCYFCHKYKTVHLDNHIIENLIKLRHQQKKNVDINYILKCCQFEYKNRNKKLPTTDEEKHNFYISLADIFTYWVNKGVTEYIEHLDK